MCPISDLLTVPEADLLALARAGSLGPLTVLDFPLERLIHNSDISGNVSCDISPFPIMLRISNHSSLIVFNKRAFKVS